MVDKEDDRTMSEYPTTCPRCNGSGKARHLFTVIVGVDGKGNAYRFDEPGMTYDELLENYWSYGDVLVPVYAETPDDAIVDAVLRVNERLVHTHDRPGVVHAEAAHKRRTEVKE